MPATPKLSDDRVLRSAHGIVEKHGVDSLSMQSVAAALDVTAPALYKRYGDRDAIVRAVQRRAFATLADALAGKRSIPELAAAYRTFARKHPFVYEAMFRDAGALEPADLEARRAAMAPLFSAIAGLVPPNDALKAARLLTAFVHGFVEMERLRAFQLGDDVDGAFAYAIDALVQSIQGART
jgi:AcrR family transcriptional regulator